MSDVPIRNIYHLLCYAWERLEARDALHLSAAPSERAEDLLAHVLREGVARLLKRGLDRGYVPHVAEERRLRGKLLLGPTLKRGALTRGSVVCETDSFTADVLHNQLIKAAMRALMGAPRLDEPLRQALRVHCLRMGEVSDVPLTLAQFRGVQLHRNNAIYGFLLDVAHLVASCMVPDEASGVRSFHPFTASAQQMGHLFEAFVRNFLRREQRHYKVSSPTIGWDLDPQDSGDQHLLPNMRTDVVLRAPGEVVVIEAKYTKRPWQDHHGTQKLRSEHLYQLLAYLTQLGATSATPPRGMLLYAGVGAAAHHTLRLRGHPIDVYHLDLSAPWGEVHEALLGMVAPRQL